VWYGIGQDLKKQQKEAKEAQDRALAQLFVPAAQARVPIGGDAKSVICEFFKLGTCTKGSKCKFSHDWNGGKKSVKMDMYS
jgi:hypothetical protein